MNYNKILIYILILKYSSSLYSMTNPFDINPILPENLQGWMGEDHKRHFIHYIKTLKPKKIVEVGSWNGMSAIFMAKQVDNGTKLYCIDPWVPYKEMEIGQPELNAKAVNIYQQFLSNCIHNNVTNIIVPMRMTSMEAVKFFQNQEIDMIYIDGSHDEKDVFDDVINWWPKVSSKGIMCGDDLLWPTVYAGASKAAKQLNLDLYAEGSFWWLVRKK